MKSDSVVRLAGASCGTCKSGKLMLEASMPTLRPIGHTKRHYRCTVCQCVAVETVDNRFL